MFRSKEVIKKYFRDLLKAYTKYLKKNLLKALGKYTTTGGIGLRVVVLICSCYRTGDVITKVKPELSIIANAPKALPL